VIIFGGMILIVVFSERKGIKIVPIISLYAMAGYRLMPALQTIYSGVTSVRYAMPAFNLIVNDLSKRTNTNKINNNSLSFSKDLEVKNLCYGYHASKNLIVNKLDLSIKKNTTIAIVGTTGSGKTTLMDLLLGLITPNSGDIYLDNIKLNDKNIHIWRNIIGYVPQSIYLTDDTIEKNIAFGVDCNEIDKSQVAKVAKIANLDNFINTLPERYDTFVGERGVRLSGGQQQRIGIARALYHDPDIIMLDEATSSLDSITENSIMEAIHNIAHQKTIIMIAHRLSTIKECDEIHMMDHGRIVDSGTYEHLISFNKEFKKMTNGAF
jgi:ABC-type multidrug transport system fused ATPase/permease subunit